MPQPSQEFGRGEGEAKGACGRQNLTSLAGDMPVPHLRFSAQTLSLVERLLESPRAATREQISAFAEDVLAELDRWQKSHFGSMNGERIYLRPKDRLPISQLEANPQLHAIEGAILGVDGRTLVLMPVPDAEYAAENAYAMMRDVVRCRDLKFRATFTAHGQIWGLANRLRKKRNIATEDDITTLAGFVSRDAEPVFVPIDREPLDERVAAKGFRLGCVGDDRKYRALVGPVPAGALVYGPYTGLMILVPPGDNGLAAAADYLDVYFTNPAKVAKSGQKLKDDPKLRAALIALKTSLENDEYPEVVIAPKRTSEDEPLQIIKLARRSPDDA